MQPFINILVHIYIYIYILLHITKKLPRYVKFRYRNRERLLVKVDRIEGNYYIGTLADNPITKGLKFGDIVKVDISKVVDIQY
jgi:hypothetical protein